MSVNKYKLPKPDDKVGGYLIGEENGRTILHEDGDKGGLFVGRSHAEKGGIQATNTDTSQPLLVEGAEAQIIPAAVKSSDTHMFNGEKMTNKQVLSAINQSGGGVAIMKNGGVVDKRQNIPIKLPASSVIITKNAISDNTQRFFDGVPMSNIQILSVINKNAGGVELTPESTEMMVSGKKYELGGKIMSDYDIVSSCGCQHSKMEEGGAIEPKEKYSIRRDLFNSIFPKLWDSLALDERGNLIEGWGIASDTDFQPIKFLDLPEDVKNKLYYAFAKAGSHVTEKDKKEIAEAVYKRRVMHIPTYKEFLDKLSTNDWYDNNEKGYSVYIIIDDERERFTSNRKDRDAAFKDVYKQYRFKMTADYILELIRPVFDNASIEVSDTNLSRVKFKIGNEDVENTTVYIGETGGYTADNEFSPKYFVQLFYEGNPQPELTQYDNIDSAIAAAFKLDGRFKETGSYSFASGGKVDDSDYEKVESIEWEYPYSDKKIAVLTIKYGGGTNLGLLTLEDDDKFLFSNWINTEIFKKEPYKTGGRYYRTEIMNEVVRLLKESDLNSIMKPDLKSTSLKYLKIIDEPSVNNVGISGKGKEDKKPKKLKLSDIPTPVKMFMPLMQQEAIVGSTEHDEILERLKGIIVNMPHQYQTDDIAASDKIVQLHYFYGKSDWYIVEKDSEPQQIQAYGYAILNGDTINAEWGYIDIEALKETNKVELDFFFTPIKFEELLEDKNKNGETKVNINSKSLPSASVSSGFEYGKGYNIPDGYSQSLLALLSKIGFVIITENNNNIYIDFKNNGKIMIVNDNGGEFNLIDVATSEHIGDVPYDTMKGPSKPTDISSGIKKEYDAYFNAHSILDKIDNLSFFKSQPTSITYDENFKTDLITQQRVDKLKSAGLSDEDIKAIFWGYEVVDKNIKADTEFSGYPSGIITMIPKYWDGQINAIVETIRNGFYEAGLKYPEVKRWQNLFQRFNLPTTPIEIIEKEAQKDGSYVEQQTALWQNEILHVSKNLGRRTISKDGTLERDSFHDFKDVEFAGGYCSIVTTKLDVLKIFLQEILSDEKNYLKDLDYLFNGLGGLSASYFANKEADNVTPPDKMGKFEASISEVTDSVENTSESTITKNNITATTLVVNSTDKLSSKKQYEINNAVTALVKEKGADRSKYSADDLAMLKLWSGSGSLAKQGARGTGLLDQFFTPPEIVSKMWGLALKYGFSFNGSNILEPACGVGRFFANVPKDVPCNIVAYDIDEIAVTICKVLYPQYDIRHASFESMFFTGRRHIGLAGLKQPFDLVISNPPYRQYVSEYAPLGEKEATGADTFEMYFIMRGIDVLRKGGLLVYIIPNTFLSNKDKYNDFKETLAKKADLLDAYRLPNGVFATTEVGTDIIVLRKK